MPREFERAKKRKEEKSLFSSKNGPRMESDIRKSPKVKSDILKKFNWDSYDSIPTFYPDKSLWKPRTPNVERQAVKTILK